MDAIPDHFMELVSSSLISIKKNVLRIFKFGISTSGVHNVASATLASELFAFFFLLKNQIM